jgi:acetyl esterase
MVGLMPMAELHPDMQAIIELMATWPLKPVQDLSPAEARAQDARHYDPFWNADAPPVAAVTDHRLPAEGRSIPIRLYDPGLVRPAPCLVYFHGGGFVLGGLDSHERVCRELALAGKVLVAAVGYRLAPEHKFPLPLDDCIVATEFLLLGDGRFGIDPRRVAVGGDSAGGNLALSTLLALRDRAGPKPRAGILVYGMFAADPDTPSQHAFGDGRYLLTSAELEWYWDRYLAGPADRRDPRAVPLLADLGGLPPLYIAAAGLDPLLDDSLRLVERLKAAGQPHLYREWPGLTHAALQMSRLLPQMHMHIADIGRWLSVALGA